MKLSGKQLTINALFCLTLLGVVIWLLYAEYDRPWKEYQNAYNALDLERSEEKYQALLLEQRDAMLGVKTQPVSTNVQSKQSMYPVHDDLERIEQELTYLKKKISETPGRKPAIKQLWLKDLNSTERCTTCHLGAENPDMDLSPHPFRTHSGDYLRHHPVEEFGCVSCHEGQGAALTVEAAHGDTKNWDSPALKGSLAQSSCGTCHLLKKGLPLGSDLPGAPVYLSGWRLFQKYNCTGCHQLQGYERSDTIAPSLTQLGNKVNKEWLGNWLKNPGDFLPKPKMPRFDFDDEEVRSISEYLLSLQSMPSDEISLPDSVDENGETLLISHGCLGCHIINEKGNDFGPELTGIGNKVKPEWLYTWLKNPAGVQADSVMPKMTIPDQEVINIVEYLSNLRKNDVSHQDVFADDMKFTEAYVEKGERLVKDYGCTGCHEIGNLPARYSAPALDGVGDKRIDELFWGAVPEGERTVANWINKRITYPEQFSSEKIVARMPNYNFSPEEADALVTFLLSFKKDAVPAPYVRDLHDPENIVTQGSKVFEMYNCQGCHVLNNRGGYTGPDLTIEARKSKPEWLFNFLKRPEKIRSVHIMKAAMPDFGLSDREANALIAYLSSVSGESYPYYSEHKKEVQSEDIWDGEKLYQEIFACNACHAVEQLGGNVGPDHTDLASRMKREWLEEWLKNPAAIKPDVRMPVYSFKEWEFEALTNYLMTLGKYRFVEIKEMP